MRSGDAAEHAVCADKGARAAKHDGGSPNAIDFDTAAHAIVERHSRPHGRVRLGGASRAQRSRDFDQRHLNFIIQLNQSLRAQGRDLAPIEKPDFSMISDAPFDIEPTKKGWLNFADVQTAVEVYTPLYALLLPRADFIRASNSLQLDEPVAIYIGKILGTDYHLSFIKNGHPLVALSTMQAGFRLMMHGLDCEALHGWLRLLKRRQAQGLPLDPRNPTAEAARG